MALRLDARESIARAVGAGDIDMQGGNLQLGQVTPENGAIRPGDLLVTAGTPGHAMRAEDPPNGTIVGEVLEPLAGGTGRIRVLVTLQ